MSNDKVYWKMKNGEVISVDEMDITYLRNTLKMIIRKVNDRKQRSLQSKSFKLNGDIAEDFNNTYIEDQYAADDYYFNSEQFI
jgi:hypothetical protein